MRWWLVLVVLGVLAGTASAERDPGACLCGATITLPHQGATDVPTNARFWTLPPTADTPDQPIQSYELAPHTTYELEAQHLSFTTGAGPDDTPPMEPGVGALTFVIVAGTYELHIAATFDSDTAVVRIRFRDQTYWTTPDRPTLCIAYTPGMGGTAEAEVVAFDLAGNASAPVTIHTTAWLVQPDQATCYDEHHHVRCGTPLIAFVYFAPFIGLVGLVVMLLAVAIRAARRRAHAEIEPLSIASATYLARAVRLRAHLSLAFVAAIAAGASVSDWLAMAAILVSPLLAVLAIGALIRWTQASRFSRLLGYDGVAAEVQADRVTIVVGGKVAFLRASPKLVAKAKRNALPRASL